MTKSPVVDVHVHLYPTPATAHWAVHSYEIWEYGDKPGLQFASASGLVDDMVARIGAQDLDHGVVVNLFARDLFRGEAIAALRPSLAEGEREVAVQAIDGRLGEMMVEFNTWLVDAVESIPQLTPFVGVDPGVISSDANVRHLEEMASHGARGVKIHPVLQGFHPSDSRMAPVYRACLEAGLTVLSHSGGSRGATELAEPSAFAGVVREFPDLRLVLAHLGGSRWRQTVEFAQAFPLVNFDLSEIVQWVNASHGPTRDELAQMILAIGPERVMLGTDYPWYDLQSTLEVLMDLPGLAEGQRQAIAGENAVRILGLAIR